MGQRGCRDRRRPDRLAGRCRPHRTRSSSHRRRGSAPGSFAARRQQLRHQRCQLVLGRGSSSRLLVNVLATAGWRYTPTIVPAASNTFPEIADAAGEARKITTSVLHRLHHLVGVDAPASPFVEEPTLKVEDESIAIAERASQLGIERAHCDVGLVPYRRPDRARFDDRRSHLRVATKLAAQRPVERNTRPRDLSQLGLASTVRLPAVIGNDEPATIGSRPSQVSPGTAPGPRSTSTARHSRQRCVLCLEHLDPRQQPRDALLWPTPRHPRGHIGICPLAAICICPLMAF